MELVRVFYVLPLTAGAWPEIGAWRLDPVGRRCQNFNHLGSDVLLAVFYHLRHHFFAGYSARDPDFLTFVTGQRLAHLTPTHQGQR
jgi:hypothetical protein